MPLVPTTSPLLSLAVLLNRLSLGVYLGFAGAMKVKGEVSGFPGTLGSFYRSPSYQGLKPGWLPEVAAGIHGYALPWVELILGILLVLGLLGRISAAVISLVLLSVLIAMLVHFKLFLGQVNYPENAPGLFHPAVIMFTLAVMLTVTGSGRFSLDALLHRRRRRLYVEKGG